MAVSAQPDFHTEWKLIQLPAHALVEMYSRQRDFTDPSGWLGLGSGDMFDLTIPPFQRGLRWDEQRLDDFHKSLIQGWPIGTMAIAIEASKIINAKNGQRKYALSLIDGQQRSWALTTIIERFWTNPWFSFESPKWEVLQPAAGPIVETHACTSTLANMAGVPIADIEEAVRDLSRSDGEAAFEDSVDFLEELTKAIGKDFPDGKAARKEARKLCEALSAQYERIRQIQIPVLLLNEALHEQLPTVFRRLNAGVPLRGYDLLAATWVSRKLAPANVALGAPQKAFLKKVLDVADKRIQESYTKVAEGYVLDPNVDPLQLEDLSLFDLLYYLSAEMAGHDSFLFASDVFAFQVSALVFNGSINRVDTALLQNFPSEPSGSPSLALTPRLFSTAAQHVHNALKPLMDVSSSNLQLKGKVGLTPAVVYLATFLTHHTCVDEASGKLVLRSRNQSASDRTVAPGWFLPAGERLTTLKETLPSWFVHDALTSVFAGSRAYEAVNERVWREFSRSGKKTGINRILKTSNTMFDFPPVDALAEAFNRLWKMEMSATKTPQRRRVSDGGAVLFRAAYCHMKVHDHAIDHVIPIGKGQSSAKLQSGAVYPLNHVANLMPVPASINQDRGDEPWSSYHTKLGQKHNAIAAALMVPWARTTTSTLASLDDFTHFLAIRYRALVAQAMRNLEHPEWAAMKQAAKDAFLEGLAN